MLDEKALQQVLLGSQVEKTAAVNALTDALFIAYGKVLITALVGEVTGVGDGTVETILLEEAGVPVALCAATTVTSDAVGTMYGLTGDPAVILCGTGNVPILKIARFLSAFGHCNLVFNGGVAGRTIELLATAGTDATLAIKWTLFWVALETGASVEAAP
jgi:hypothetical protein